MVGDVKDKLIDTREFEWSDVHTNFRIFADGVHCYSNEGLKEAIRKIKRDKIRHQILIFDEVGQELMARGYMSKEQSELCAFAWQGPKRDIIWMFASNPGNSADVILRDAAWQSIMPRYFFGETHEDDYIVSDIIHNYECRISRGIVRLGVSRYQEMFDSFEPID